MIIPSEEDDAIVLSLICVIEFMYEWCPFKTPDVFNVDKVIIEIVLSKEPAAIRSLVNNVIEEIEFLEGIDKWENLLCLRLKIWIVLSLQSPITLPLPKAIVSEDNTSMFPIWYFVLIMFLHSLIGLSFSSKGKFWCFSLEKTNEGWSILGDNNISFNFDIKSLESAVQQVITKQKRPVISLQENNKDLSDFVDIINDLPSLDTVLDKNLLKETKSQIVARRLVTSGSYKDKANQYND